MDGKSHAYQRDIELSGHGTSFGVAYGQVRFQVPGDFFHPGKVHIVLDGHLVENPFRDTGLQGFFKVPTVPPRGTEHRDDAHLCQKSGKACDKVLFSINDGPLFRNIFVPIHIGVHQPPFLFFIFFRRGFSGDGFHMFKKPITGFDAHGNFQAGAGDIEPVGQEGPGTLCALVHHEGKDGSQFQAVGGHMHFFNDPKGSPPFLYGLIFQPGRPFQPF